MNIKEHINNADWAKWYVIYNLESYFSWSLSYAYNSTTCNMQSGVSQFQDLPRHEFKGHPETICLNVCSAAILMFLFYFSI